MSMMPAQYPCPACGATEMHVFAEFNSQQATLLLEQNKKLKSVLQAISDEGWYAHSNNAAQLVEILDEHKRAADEALGITDSTGGSSE